MKRSIPFLGAMAVAAVATATALGDDRVPAPAAGLPVAAFEVSSVATARTAVTFDASASTAVGGGALAYGWDFGHDGARMRGAKVAHVFAQPGIYAVTLTVVDSAGRVSKESRRVVVEAARGTLTAGR